MRWEDEGVVLQVRSHAESGRIIEVLTSSHGLARGYVRGGQRRPLATTLQSGTMATVAWNARLAEHLGQFRVEPRGSLWTPLRADPNSMAALASMFALLSSYLPEREPCTNLYRATLTTIETLRDPAVWPTAYAHWEVGLLHALGYGLQLDACAATGVRTELTYVSPRTGRAVSRGSGEPYHDRLLTLPRFLTAGGRASAMEFHQAMRLTGHFLEKKIAAVTNSPLPNARTRFATRMEQWLAAN